MTIKDIQKQFVERLKFFAAHNKVEPQELKVLIFHNKEKGGAVQFNEYVKGVFTRELRAKEDILDLPKFDFLQKTFKMNFGLGVITNALVGRLERKHGTCEKHEVRVLVYVKTPEQEVPTIRFYKDGDTSGGEFVSWQELEDIF